MSGHRLNVHGGNIYETSKDYGIRQEEILDYSVNINPLGVPENVRNIIISNIDNIANYPDNECSSLKSGVSRYLNIPESKIIIGNGASEIISLFFDVIRPKRICIPAPTFVEYADTAKCFGIEVNYFKLNEEEDFKLDLNSLLSYIDDGIDALVLCNPNNPTSKLIKNDELLELIKYTYSKNIYIMLDEAFIELTERSNNNSMVAALNEYNNLFIVRAYTKLFALPGLRLGYGLGDESIIKKMWERKLPWSVNTFANCLGDIFTIESDYLLRTTKWITEEKKWFYNELCKQKKFKAFEPSTNFILLKILDEGLNAAILKDKLLLKGILIRDASNFVFLNNKFIRLAIRDRESNLKLLNALIEVL